MLYVAQHHGAWSRPRRNKGSLGLRNTSTAHHRQSGILGNEATKQNTLEGETRAHPCLTTKASAYPL